MKSLVWTEGQRSKAAALTLEDDKEEPARVTPGPVPRDLP